MDIEGEFERQHLLTTSGGGGEIPRPKFSKTLLFGQSPNAHCD